MARSRSSSGSSYGRTGGGDTIGVNGRWTAGEGWTAGLTILGAATTQIPISAGAVYSGCAVVAAGAGAVVAAGAAAVTVAFVSRSVWNWATADGEAQPQIFTQDLIRQQRLEQEFDEGLVHVGLCGPAGSGKSSITNALRGLRNNSADAATTSTIETTLAQSTYIAHDSLRAVALHDCPGAGTLRNPTDQYYEAQKLYLFDLLVIMLGERVGEVSRQIMLLAPTNLDTFLLNHYI